MASLVCDVCNCAYNNACYCSKGDIMVGGKHARQEADTCCDSFRETTSETYKSAMDHPSTTIHIDCEADKCMYNSNFKCYADNVTIKGNGAHHSAETLCATFKER